MSMEDMLVAGYFLMAVVTYVILVGSATYYQRCAVDKEFSVIFLAVGPGGIIASICWPLTYLAVGLSWYAGCF